MCVCVCVWRRECCWIDADGRGEDANRGQDGEEGKKFCYMLNGQRWRPEIRFIPRLKLPQEVKEYMAEPAQQHYGIVVIKPGQLNYDPGVCLWLAVASSSPCGPSSSFAQRQILRSIRGQPRRQMRSSVSGALSLHY